MTETVEYKRATGFPTVRRLYTLQQAADVAEEPIEEIRYWVRIGKLKVNHLGGGRVRIDEADLLASIEPRELEW
jgi:predicted site-specific integrase-resolvase